MALADEILRVCHLGGVPNYQGKSESNKGKIGTATKKTKLEREMESMQLLSREEMKHDMDYLSMQKDLKGQSNDYYMRKRAKLNAKHEAKYEKALEEKKEAAEALNRERANKVGKPSLTHAVDFLANYFVRYLPSAQCKICKKAIFMKLKSEKDPNTPERNYCGHWVHRCCLERVLNKPPFIIPCGHEGCGDSMGNLNYPNDPIAIKNREKQWTS